MSQFDQTTKQEAAKAVRITHGMSESVSIDESVLSYRLFAGGRNSPKASMEILARANKVFYDAWFAHGCKGSVGTCLLCNAYEAAKPMEAIAQVKANGDWPLEEK